MQLNNKKTLKYFFSKFKFKRKKTCFFFSYNFNLGETKKKICDALTI